jgi:hypothetical protein
MEAPIPEIVDTSGIISVEKPEGKRLLGGSRCQWIYNIKVDLREI